MGSTGNLTGIERKPRRGPAGAAGSDATVTAQAIADALGFLPQPGGDSMTREEILAILTPTTSAELSEEINDETGSGALVFAVAPTLTNPVVGTQAPGDNSDKAASTAFVTAAVAAGGGGSSLTVPLVAAFTQVGANATFANKSDRLQGVLNTFSGSLQAMMQNIPAAPYTIDTCISLHALSAASNTAMAGIALSNGTAYRTIGVGSADGNALRMFAWSSASSVSSTILSTTQQTITFARFYLRVTSDGATRNWYASNDGRDYILVFTEAENTGITATKVGFFFYDDANKAMKMGVNHWLISASVLGDAA